MRFGKGGDPWMELCIGRVAHATRGDSAHASAGTGGGKKGQRGCIGEAKGLGLERISGLWKSTTKRGLIGCSIHEGID